MSDRDDIDLLTPQEDDGDVVGVTEPLAGSPTSKPLHKPAKASLISSVSNLANTIMGSGILALPFAFKSSGILLGSVLLVIVATFQDYTVSLLRKTADITKQRTYGAVAMYVMGPKFGLVVDICVALQTFGVCVAYVVITGDLFPALLTTWFDISSWVNSRAFVMAVFTFCVIFPLCLLKKMDSLKYTSYVAVASIIYLTVYVVWKSQDLHLEDEVILAKADSSVFLTVPIISLAYTCHFNWFPIRSELEKPTKKRQFIVIHTAFLVVSLLYALVGCFGYVTFYEGVHGNILVNYLENDIFVQIGRIGVVFTVVCSFPILAYSTREAILRSVFPREYAAGYAANYPGPEGIVADSMTRLRSNRWKSVVVSLIICSCAYVLALIVPDIAFVLGLVGATASTLICYVFPAIFYLKMARDMTATTLIPSDDELEEEEEVENGPVDMDVEEGSLSAPKSFIQQWFGCLYPRNRAMAFHVGPSIIVMVLGIMFGIVGTYQTLASGKSLH